MLAHLPAPANDILKVTGFIQERVLGQLTLALW